MSCLTLSLALTQFAFDQFKVADGKFIFDHDKAINLVRL